MPTKTPDTKPIDTTKRQPKPAPAAAPGRGGTRRGAGRRPRTLALRFAQQVENIEAQNLANSQRWILTLADGSKLSLILSKPNAAELVRTSEL